MIRYQSVSSGRRARAWQAAIAACSGCRPSPEALGARERLQAAADQQRVPAPAVLVEQQDGVAGAVRPGVQRDAWISISATSPCASDAAGREPGEDAAEPQRVLAQLGAHPVVAGRGRVALVEDQVDDLEDGREPRRERVAARHLERARARPRAPRLARTIRCATVASGTRNARAIAGVVRPPSIRSVSAHAPRP